MEQKKPHNPPKELLLPENIPDKHRHIGILAKEGVKTGEIAKALKMHIGSISRIKKKVKKHLLFKPAELKRAAKRTVSIAQGDPVKLVKDRGKQLYDETGKPLMAEATIDQQLKAQHMMFEVEVPKKQINEYIGGVAIAIGSLDEFLMPRTGIQPTREEKDKNPK